MRRRLFAPRRRKGKLQMGTLPGPRSEAVAQSACIAVAGVAVCGWLVRGWVGWLSDPGSGDRPQTHWALLGLAFVVPGWFVGLGQSGTLRRTSAVVLYVLGCGLAAAGVLWLTSEEGMTLPSLGLLLAAAALAAVGGSLGRLVRGRTAAAVAGSLALIVALVVASRV